MQATQISGRRYLGTDLQTKIQTPQCPVHQPQFSSSPTVFLHKFFAVDADASLPLDKTPGFLSSYSLLRLFLHSGLAFLTLQSIYFKSLIKCFLL